MRYEKNNLRFFYHYDFDCRYTPLLETLDLDSLDLVDVVVLVDKNFGVTLTGPDFKELKTFQDFYDLIISRTNGK